MECVLNEVLHVEVFLLANDRLPRRRLPEQRMTVVPYGKFIHVVYRYAVLVRNALEQKRSQDS